MKGLIGASSESAADGLLLWECPRIHTHWMQFALDVLYLDGDGIVLAQENDIPPGRVGMHVYGARHVLEIPAGTWAREVRIGERLIVDMGV